MWSAQVTPVTLADRNRLRASGQWASTTLRRALADAAQRFPDRVALVGRRRAGGRDELSYRDFDAAAHDAAGRLTALGVGPGDVVAMMMPNCVEYPTILFGINEIGAIYTGIPVAYGELQAAAVLRNSRARAVIIPRRWRRSDHVALVRRLREQLPSLEFVVVVDDDEAPLEITEPGEHRWRELPPSATLPPEPRADQLCYLGFTSGTTGEPKGAMHSHETLLHPADALFDHLGVEAFGNPMIQLVGSPAGHHTGFVWGILFTLRHGGTGVHLDVWDADWAAQVIREEHATTMFGAPTFLQDLMRTDLAGDPNCPLSSVVVAGSSIPRGLPERAGEALSACIAPAWGMTECGILTSTTAKDTGAALRTDGTPTSGSEIRCVGPDGVEVGPGEVGDLEMRGPGVTLGYYNRPDATRESFAVGLWFRTGDTASIDAQGRLEIHGRTKDIIIRGGENIPVADVESVILDDPAVEAAAVVGYPDPRLGERACAVLRLRHGTALDLATLNARLEAAGLSRHYLPERLLIVDAMPTTASGKIQKFRLRELVSELADGTSRA
jgi:cyclohexanecarboxylate-CoA ligase